MKLELYNYQDYDGEWYIVEVNGKKKYFKVADDGGNREEVLKESTDWYERLKNNFSKKEVIFSEEI